MIINPLLRVDSYKLDHRRQYPAGTSMVYSNFTPRSAKLCPIPAHLYDGHVINFGLQFWIKDVLLGDWQTEFFDRPKAEVVRAYRRRLDAFLGEGAVPVEHIEALHDLQYLPIVIKALPEGTKSPIKVPVLVIYNSLPGFYWLTNYLETDLSASLWKPMTTATSAYYFRKMLDHYADLTGADPAFCAFQGHDFSARGMSGMADSVLSSAAHLTSFVGSDTIAAVDLIEKYYNGDSSTELIACSVPASEHSVMRMGGCDDELGTFRRFITELYPAGSVSIVSDTWDLWKVLTEYAPALKAEIMARDGKLVFRPDSGDPVKIIGGDLDATYPSPAFDGVVELLWGTFKGTQTAEGFAQLDSHVGAIYGDSITFERGEGILKGLMEQGFASSNIVFGNGSYGYQYCTRDTFGFAVKSTYGEVNGVGREIYKDPITDDGIKKSARGLLKVVDVDGVLTLLDRQPTIDSPDDCLREVFRDGNLLVDDSFAAIRARVAASR